MMTDPIFAITLECAMVNQWDDIDHAMEASSFKKNVKMGARMVGGMIVSAIKTTFRAIGGLFLRFGTFILNKIKEFRDRKKTKAAKEAAKAKGPTRTSEKGLYRSNADQYMTEEEATDFNKALAEARDLMDGIFKNKFTAELARFANNPVSYARNHLGKEADLKEAYRKADDRRRDFNAAMMEVSRAVISAKKVPPASCYRSLESMGAKIQEMGKYALEQAKIYDGISAPSSDTYFSDDRGEEINALISEIQEDAKWYFKGFTGTCNDCYQRIFSILKDMDAAIKAEDAQAA